MQFGWRTRRAGPRSLDFTNGDLRINEQLCIKMDGAHYRAALEAEDPDYSITLKIASMLNRGLIGDAVLYASTSRWSGPRLKKFNFDPSEPRDVNGRWAKGGSSATDKAYLTPIGYNGYFHDAVVDDIMDFFRKDGSLAEKNIRFTNIVGMTVIPDFVFAEGV